MDRAFNFPRGYGYVEFKMRVDTENALMYMDGAQIDGNVVKMKFTLPARPNSFSTTLHDHHFWPSDGPCKGINT